MFRVAHREEERVILREFATEESSLHLAINTPVICSYKSRVTNHGSRGFKDKKVEGLSSPRQLSGIPVARSRFPITNSGMTE